MTTTTTNQLRKGAAALALPVPVLVHPRAPPAPVLGQGPGKRVQVQGNSRQNVSISSIFLMIYWTTSVMCPVMLFFLLFSPFSSPHLWRWETPCADWSYLMILFHFEIPVTWNECIMNWLHRFLAHGMAGNLQVCWCEPCRSSLAIVNWGVFKSTCVIPAVYEDIFIFSYCLLQMISDPSFALAVCELTCSILMELL